MRQPLLNVVAALACLAAHATAAQAEKPTDPVPQAVPTFHCLGLYWSPLGGNPDREVLVRYRQPGSPWRDGLSLRYHPIDGTDRDLADYRGSIVDLDPATTYEIELSLQGTDTTARFAATTWSEQYPIGETVPVGDRSTPLVIDQSGTPDAYRVYDGRGATIDVQHQHDACIVLNASYVILRGFTLKGAGKPAESPRGTIGAIQIDRGHDLVIQECDISDWGRLDPATGFARNMDAGIYSRQDDLARLVVERCRIHHPTYDGSTWHEPTYPTHTAGTQAITLYNSAGNHVIRYNEFYSDLDHMMNDVVGGGSNGSYEGAPGPDSDIYGNLVSHCWDDGLEVEGGNRNNRVWGNYITQCMISIGNAATSIGPLYVYRNVVERNQSQPDDGGLHFLKMGFAGGEEWMTGTMYIFHNTLYEGDGWLPKGGLGGDRIVKHCVSRNNILHVRESNNWSASANDHNIANDFDHDLSNGRIPDGQEAHGIHGVPVYGTDAGFDPATRTGRFELAPNSPGVAAGEPIPNFSGIYEGPAPDIGAHQTGTPPMRFGIEAGR